MHKPLHVLSLALALVLGALPARANPLVINELVADPQTDWNGDLSIDDGDEFIELKNVSATQQSLAGYILEMNDTSATTDVFDPNGPATQRSEAYRLFDSAGAEITPLPAPIVVPAGGYLVLFNPYGTLNTTGTVNLLNQSGDPVDQIGFDANAGSTADEAYSRFPDGADTDNDAADFVLRGGTPGHSNGEFCSIAAGQFRINEAIGDPQTDWDGSGGVDGDHDEYIELKNVSGGALDLSGCVLDMTDTTAASFLFQPADAPAAPFVKVYDPNGNLVGTAPQLTAVPAGGYVVLFDPPGQMNSTGTVEVLLRAGQPGPDTTVDSISGTLDADSAADESLSRFPDGGVYLLQKKGTPGRTNGLGSVGVPHQQLINEVILTPSEDYDGTGGVTRATDQVIELYNASAQTIDLTGWQIEMLDSSPVCLLPLVKFGRATFSAGGAFDAWKSGEYLTLAHPSGQMNDDVYIQLLDFQGNTVDDVEIGGNTATTDYEGDGAGDGAPELGENGEAVGIGDSAFARVPNGTDTDNDLANFTRQEPTLGASNTITRNDTTPPALDLGNTTTGDGFPITGYPQVSFHEPIDLEAVKNVLILLRKSGALPEDPVLAQGLGVSNQDKTVFIAPRGALLPSTTYTLEIVPGIKDRAGNALAASGVISTFTTEAAPADNAPSMRINEVVVDAQRDWKGKGFGDPNAPQGSNTSTDEWVELYNAGASPLDLSLWSLESIDSSRDSVSIGAEMSGRVVVCFNSAGTVIGDDSTDCYKSLPSHGYLIVGDPPGSLGSDVFLALRNSQGNLVDTVEIGGDTESSDYGGDGQDNGAPGAQDGDALGLYDEAVARVPDGVDTGNELTDWAKQRATLGRSNDLDPPADSTPPTIASFGITRQVGGKARADTDLILTFSEPMALGTINEETVRLADSQNSVGLKFEYALNDTQALLSWTGILDLGQTYTLLVKGRQVGVHDVAGNPMAADASFQFTVEPAPAPATGLMLNEIVTDPQQDWDDSLCGPGVPFDTQVGLDIGASGDEWLELYNKGGQANFSSWTVVMKDSDYAEHLLGDTEDGSVERYSSGGANGVIAGGGYMMIGDPPGSMLDSVIVLLRNPGGVLVDYVRVRGAADSLDNEVYARFPSGTDTNVDIIDFTNLAASPLGQNNQGVRPPEAANRFDVLLTEVVVDPQSDWDDSGGAAGQPFDAQPYSGPEANHTTSDEYVELANVSTKVIKLTGWTLSMVDSSPAVYVIGSDPDIEYYSAGASADYFPRGAIVVIGNPAGSMNNDVFLALEDARGKLIDKVEIGGGTASKNFEADDDRDGQVDEDHIDGEDDDGDGLIDEDPVGADPVGDGIPKKGDGNSTGPQNESFRRINKTGVDQQDWSRGPGNPRSANLSALLQTYVGSGDALAGGLLGLVGALAGLRRRLRKSAGSGPRGLVG